MLSRFSASELFNEITGESQWEEIFDHDDFLSQNTEFFDHMSESSDVSEDVDDSEEQPTRQPHTPLILAPLCSENECSICFCEFDSFVASTLPTLSTSCNSPFISSDLTNSSWLWPSILRQLRDKLPSRAD